jgi:hypothetical protein
MQRCRSPAPATFEEIDGVFQAANLMEIAETIGNINRGGKALVVHSFLHLRHWCERRRRAVAPPENMISRFSGMKIAAAEAAGLLSRLSIRPSQHAGFLRGRDKGLPCASPSRIPKLSC